MSQDTISAHAPERPEQPGFDRRSFLVGSGTVGVLGLLAWLDRENLDLVSNTSESISEVDEAQLLHDIDSLITGPTDITAEMVQTFESLEATFGEYGIDFTVDTEGQPEFKVSEEYSKAFDQLRIDVEQGRELTTFDMETLAAGLVETNGEKITERDAMLRAFDIVGTAYFVYSLGKIVNRSNRSTSAAIEKRKRHDYDWAKGEGGHIHPHFDRVDFAVIGALHAASYARANQIGDEEQKQHVTDHINETVVATTKVGLDIALSMFLSDEYERTGVIEERIAALKSKYDGDPKGYKEALYWNIRRLATLGSTFVSTNLGVSMSGPMIREYCTEFDEDGNAKRDEHGQTIYNERLRYIMVAQVADLSGDVAFANALIPAGDIAPREIFAARLGRSNLHRSSINAIGKRVVNEIAGFPAGIAYGEFASDQLDGTSWRERWQKAKSSFFPGRNIARAILRRQRRPALDAQTIHDEDVLVSDRELQATGLTGYGRKGFQWLNKNIIKGHNKPIDQRFARFIEVHRERGQVHVDSEGINRSRVDNTNALTAVADALERTGSGGKKLASALHKLNHRISGPAPFYENEQVLGSTLGEALNVLPYQLLSATFVSSLMKEAFVQDEAVTIKSWEDSTMSELIRPNLDLHVIGALMSGFADNGFTISVGLSVILKQLEKAAKNFTPEQNLQEFLTLQAQNSMDASQAGGGVAILGCSAHFNELELETKPISDIFLKAGLPVFMAHLGVAIVVNSALAKQGLLLKLDIPRDTNSHS